jgi:hypothetical protein
MNLINPNSKVLLEDIRLSDNPDKQVEDYANGINGKINVTEDGRKYYVAVFSDAENPLAQERTRIVSQNFDSQGNPVWKAGRPSKMKKFIGSLLPGEIVTREVNDYEVGENTVSIYTCVVLKNESISTVFKQQGHEILGNQDDFVEDIDMDDAPVVETEAPQVSAPEVTMQ